MRELREKVAARERSKAVLRHATLDQAPAREQRRHARQAPRPRLGLGCAASCLQDARARQEAREAEGEGGAVHGQDA